MDPLERRDCELAERVRSHLVEPSTCALLENDECRKGGGSK